MSKVTIVLDERQQAELKMLLVDNDAPEALRFLKEVVWAQVQAANRRGMRGHLEQGRE